MTLRIVKATRDHLVTAALDLSKGDLEEFHCNKANRNPVDVLPLHLDSTTHAIMLGSLVLAVGGSRHPDIWFVTTNVVETLDRAERIGFYRLLKEHLADVRDRGPNQSFTNFVSKNNKGHIRLLESLGATFQSGYVMSEAGFQFKQFWL
ncbi:hypothetical protein PspYZU08_39 [Pseudomonas phage PspYZU08]|uniref:Internal virion protein A n=1 Tax=Pseudomonas phage PspYZU08 TaxID=1983557 RepID=A0A2U7N2W1_9CAUD|nr:internal virion protein [Pseudomonas phage PspYZU08]ASD52215.1 hypothetical protein PspYZU08_39 [Pseudomonas phage PspYZU08]